MIEERDQQVPSTQDAREPGEGAAHDAAAGVPVEVGGRKGPEPTRFGDWEKNGRCIDF